MKQQKVMNNKNGLILIKQLNNCLNWQVKLLLQRLTKQLNMRRKFYNKKWLYNRRRLKLKQNNKSNKRVK